MKVFPIVAILILLLPLAYAKLSTSFTPADALTEYSDSSEGVCERYNLSRCEFVTAEAIFYFNESVHEFVFIHFGGNTSRPSISSERRKMLFEDVQELVRKKAFIETRLDLDPIELTRQVHNVTNETANAQSTLNGKGRYTSVHMTADGTITNVEEGFPVYYQYDLLQNAKNELGMKKISISKVYFQDESGIIRYGTNDGNYTYIGYGKLEGKTFTQEGFDSVRRDYFVAKVQESPGFFTRFINWFRNLFS